MAVRHLRNRAARVGDARRRHAAERLLRVWRLVEDIARTPGKSRGQIAREQALSERQVQDDLSLIREEFSLPLVRRQGYRFAEEGAGKPSEPLSLAEAQLLLLLIRRAARDPSLPADRTRSMIAKLPALFPPYLRPLAARTLAATEGDEALLLSRYQRHL